MISLTAKAKKRIHEVSDDEGLGYYSVRIKVEGGGCSGFVYDLFFDNQQNANDEVFKHDDITIFVDPISNQYLEDSELDYVEEVIGGSFRVVNPNVKSTCGCGHSYEF